MHCPFLLTFPGFLRCWLPGLLFLVPLAALSAPARPLNVVLIISDDLRTDLGCYGTAEARTPNLDRLAAESLVFDRAYCQYPVCNASRSSFLTGWRPDRVGYYDNDTQLRKVHPGVVALPQLLRENGYRTAGIGKLFHSGTDENGQRVFFRDIPSFDHFSNYLRATTELGKMGVGRNLSVGDISWCKWLATDGGDQDQSDGMATEDALRFLRENRNRPFFLGLGLHKPHNPFNAPKAYFDRFPAGSISLHRIPEDASPDHPLALPSQKKDFLAFSDADRLEFKRAYYACVSFMDAQVGKILDQLRDLGLAENTLVIFMSDHGYHLGEHGWWNKVTVFELCARVPLIVRVPGRPANGARTSALVELVDLYPTLAGLCGLPPPTAGLDGRSFAHLLDDPSQPAKPAAFTQVTRGSIMGRSVRTDRWRYTEWDFGRQGTELYAHPSDPHEYHNLAASPDLASTRAELKALLDAAYPPL